MTLINSITVITDIPDIPDITPLPTMHAIHTLLPVDTPYAPQPTIVMPCLSVTLFPDKEKVATIVTDLWSRTAIFSAGESHPFF